MSLTFMYYWYVIYLIMLLSNVLILFLPDNVLLCCLSLCVLKNTKVWSQNNDWLSVKHKLFPHADLGCTRCCKKSQQRVSSSFLMTSRQLGFACRQQLIAKTSVPSRWEESETTPTAHVALLCVLTQVLPPPFFTGKSNSWLWIWVTSWCECGLLQRQSAEKFGACF